MKITAVRYLKVQGVMEYPGAFWEERLVRPMDIYPEHHSEPFLLRSSSDGRYPIEGVFLYIETDSGPTGSVGPIGVDQAYVIATELAPLLIGHDPLATERIWDRLYRSLVHGRQGVAMMALSLVDCALWDLKAKWAGVPLYKLLGGPTRDAIPTYASVLGYSVQPERAAERSVQLVKQGYRALKWFFRYGPADGAEGMAKNVAFVRAVRQAVGPDVDIMLDAWMSWDVHYTLEMAHRLEEFRPRWLEEVLFPDQIDRLAEIRSKTTIPIATGEHEYTRWGIKRLLDAHAADVLQPDVCWAGGYSEMQKICALASAYSVPVIPHGDLVHATLHVVASQPPGTCPLLEYLLKWGAHNQWFLTHPVSIANGMTALPSQPGIGMDLDEAKIEKRQDLMF